MKRIALILALLLITSNCYGTVVDRYVTAATVTVTTVAFVATLDTVCNNIMIINEDTIDDVYISIDGVGWNSDYTTYYLPTTASTELGAKVIKVEPNSSISLEFSSKIVGWVVEPGTRTAVIQYIITGDIGQL